MKMIVHSRQGGGKNTQVARSVISLTDCRALIFRQLMIASRHDVWKSTSLRLDIILSRQCSGRFTCPDSIDEYNV